MLSMDVLQFIKWCNNVRTTENLLLWRQKYKSVFRTMWANYPSLFWLQDEVVPFLQCGCYLMWGYCFVIRFVWQKMEKKTNEKNLSTLPVSYFLFTVRHNKWLVSIPPENNITPAVAFCPCLPCLPPPVFSFSLHLFFSEHVVTGRHSPPHPTYTHTPPTLHSHLNSISPPRLEHSPFPCTNPFPSPPSSALSILPHRTERSQHYSSRGAGEG